MAHGYPDFAQSAGVNTVYQLRDLAELAARLGSIDTFDRRGDVFFLEDFEHGATCFGSTGNGTGNSSYLSLERARSKSFSYKLVSGSTGAHDRYLYVRTGLPSLSKVGFEVSIELDDSNNVVEWLLQCYDGVNALKGHIKYDDSVNKLYYLNSASAWVEFATNVIMLTTPGMFNTAKLVIDSVNAKYSRFILNATGYSLADIALESTPSIYVNQVYAYVRFVGESGDNDIAYVDDWILTQNEP